MMFLKFKEQCGLNGCQEGKKYGFIVIKKVCDVCVYVGVWCQILVVVLFVIQGIYVLLIFVFFIVEIVNWNVGIC